MTNWTPDVMGAYLEPAIFQALGAASTACEETPTGVFDSTRAKEIGDGLVEWMNDNFPTYFDEETLFKVMRPLLEAGLTEAEAQHAINEMQNSGLYFREKKPNATDVAVGSTPNG